MHLGVPILLIFFLCPLKQHLINNVQKAQNFRTSSGQENEVAQRSIGKERGQSQCDPVWQQAEKE
jgi:hypothetical protein